MMTFQQRSQLRYALRRHVVEPQNEILAFVHLCGSRNSAVVMEGRAARLAQSDHSRYNAAIKTSPTTMLK